MLIKHSVIPHLLSFFWKKTHRKLINNPPKLVAKLIFLSLEGDNTYNPSLFYTVNTAAVKSTIKLRFLYKVAYKVIQNKMLRVRFSDTY